MNGGGKDEWLPFGINRSIFGKIEERSSFFVYDVFVYGTEEIIYSHTASMSIIKAKIRRPIHGLRFRMRGGWHFRFGLNLFTTHLNKVFLICLIIPVLLPCVKFVHKVDDRS